MPSRISQLKPIAGRWYTASFHEPSTQMRIVSRRGKFSMFVPLVSACDQPGKRDVTGRLSDFSVRRKGQVTVLTFVEKSALWARKEYTIEFEPERIKYHYTVFGRGKVDRAYFFRSWFSDPATVEQELGVAPGFDTVWSPAINFMGKTRHFPGDTSIITCGEDNMYWGSGLVSAPLCFCLNDQADDNWVWAGLGARPGQYGFDEFTWNSNVTKRIYGAGGFDCNFSGKLRIDGSWQSPHLVIGLANDPYRGLEDYVGMLDAEYDIKLPRRKSTPDWWKSPIFCGWGEQMSLGYRDHGNVEGVSADVYCTQAMHDRWLGILRKHRIRPGQIIIDAGWETEGTRGDMYVDHERWPDLRGWIEARRAEGVRTHLWMMAWSRIGVPDDECITRDGKAVACDPTNPRYEARLRAMVRRLISDEAGCYNADGVKIDGEMTCPTGPGLKNRGNVWGLELQRRWMQIVHSEVKKHKPDAAVGLFAANPYLAEFGDLERTADMFSIKPSPEDTMFHRARILSIANPACMIDTDHAYWYDVRDNWIDIMPAQLRVPNGVPCMYHAEYVWHKRPFCRPYIEKMTPEQYAVVRKTFDAQWRKISGKKK